MRILWLVVFAAACRATLPSADTTQDADGDGVLVGDDCNDTDPLVFPGAVESCNGVDDDCNGAIDDIGEGQGTALYADSDQDGYGEGEPIYACEAFDGVTELAGDCDDSDGSIFPGAPEPDCTDTVDRDCDGFAPAEDADEDGFAACEDCNDDDANVRPGAVERCNGVDDDCNDLIDDDAVDAPIWYRDGDEDGFGDADQTEAACDAPEGFVGSSADCDDTNQDIRPGADETCDGVDQDCDGGVDEQSIDAPQWFADSDEDGFGGPLSVRECSAPAGFLAESTDCNDLDPLAFPNAPETCNGADDDCDQVVDNDAVDPTTWYADPDGDSWGDASTGTTAACVLPDGFAVRNGDCAEGDAGVNPGAVETCNGIDDDCDQDIDENAVNRDTFYADSDGDGYGDARFAVLACALPDAHADNADDCNDGLASVNPMAPERCNGIDDDCNSEIDDDPIDLASFYRDTDGDGYGVAGDVTEACDAPDGYVADAGDCAPDDLSVFPTALELCNGVDDDCDDEMDEDAVDAPSWYADVDGDGYGGERFVEVACDQPEGFFAEAEDCDDLDSDVSPEAVDVCGDGIDQDCDGEDRTGIDGGSPECAAISCAAILETDTESPNGAYWIDATGTAPVETWCDQTGGGWTLAFVKNSVDQNDYGDFGSGYVRTENLTVDPADASAASVGMSGWMDMNEASWTELRIHSYRNGTESFRSDVIDRASLRIDFGQDGYLLYGEHGYFWCGGDASYTDAGRGQVNRPSGAPADCKGHGSLGDGWDFSRVTRTNSGLTLCGASASRWMHDAFAGVWVYYPNAGAAHALWVR